MAKVTSCEGARSLSSYETLPLAVPRPSRSSRTTIHKNTNTHTHTHSSCLQTTARSTLTRPASRRRATRSTGGGRTITRCAARRGVCSSTTSPRLRRCRCCCSGRGNAILVRQADRGGWGGGRETLRCKDYNNRGDDANTWAREKK